MPPPTPVPFREADASANAFFVTRWADDIADARERRAQTPSARGLRAPRGRRCGAALVAPPRWLSPPRRRGAAFRGHATRRSRASAGAPRARPGVRSPPRGLPRARAVCSLLAATPAGSLAARPLGGAARAPSSTTCWRSRARPPRADVVAWPAALARGRGARAPRRAWGALPAAPPRRRLLTVTRAGLPHAHRASSRSETPRASRGGGSPRVSPPWSPRQPSPFAAREPVRRRTASAARRRPRSDFWASLRGDARVTLTQTRETLNEMARERILQARLA